MKTVEDSITKATSAVSNNKVDITPITSALKTINDSVNNAMKNYTPVGSIIEDENSIFTAEPSYTA